MEHLDCRGLACPGPVIQVKKQLEKTLPGGSFSIEIDSEVSRDNVRRFAKSRHARVQSENTDSGGFLLKITAPPDALIQEHEDTWVKPPVVLITGQTIGENDEKLGRILMEGFITTLKEQAQIPDRILFMNSGVKFAVEGSVVLDTLRGLTDQGSEILVCGTCLDFFSLKEQLAVGVASNMFDIQKILIEADSVIKL